ncbi:MAG: HlyD family efflux transporter periplasmic adaptor subunit [Bacteroidota bacterium]
MRESPIRQMSFRESRKTVAVHPVEYKSREIALSSLGRVVSESAAEVISEVQGEILPGSVPLKRGQRFRQGQILFKVDDQEAKLILFAEKSNFMTSIASILPDLKIDYPDSYPAWQAYFDGLSVEGELPSLPAVEQSQEKVFLSTRNIFNQYYALKSSEERLSKYIIRAPFSGSFLDVLQEVNSVVNPGTRVARIARSNRLELEAPVSKSDLDFIKIGTKVDLFSENKESKWKGTVSRFGSIMDPSTQSINMYVSFSTGGKQVFEGQYLRIEIPGTRIRNVMEVPRKAIVNQNQLYWVNDSNRLELATIQVEKLTEETLFFSGLDEGRKVVIEPLFNAYENMPVNIAGEGGAGKKGKAAGKGKRTGNKSSSPAKGNKQPDGANS